MTVRSAGALDAGRRVYTVARAGDATMLAASIAYYAFVSLLPALLLMLIVASIVASDRLALALVESTGEFLAPAGQALVADAFDNAAGRSGATVLGLVVLVWSTLKVFRALDVAFSRLYGIHEQESFVEGVRDSAVVLGSIGVGVALMLGAGAVVAASRFAAVVAAASVVVLPVLLTVIFLPMYYVFPDTDVSLREVLPGGVVAAVGWTVLQAGFQVYAANASQYEAYGVLGGLLLLVTWFYLGALVLFFGVAVNVVRAGRDRQVQQGPARQTETMSGSDADDGEAVDGDAREGVGDERPRGAPDVAELDERVDELRADLDAFESDVHERTVDREGLERELKRYVRSRMRRGHARGWGPYLVLLYGTVMTLGAFYFLEGVWAVLSMIVLFLSTLGLYALFVIVGVGLNVLDVPGKAVDAVRDRRS